MDVGVLNFSSRPPALSRPAHRSPRGPKTLRRPNSKFRLVLQQTHSNRSELPQTRPNSTIKGKPNPHFKTQTATQTTTNKD